MDAVFGEARNGVFVVDNADRNPLAPQAARDSEALEIAAQHDGTRKAAAVQGGCTVRPEYTASQGVSQFALRP